MKRVMKFFRMFFIVFVAVTLFFTLLYKFVNPPLTPLMAQRFVEQIFDEEKEVRFKRDYVPIEDISPNLINAVVASEDGKFMQHSGFDFEELERSYKSNKANKGKKIRGGSTISMQTAKNAFLFPHRTYVRKAFEAYFTKLIELMWGKKRIMEVYLNIIEFGDGIYGCEAAAQHYFNKSSKELTKTEAAQLAVSLPNPRKFNPNNRTQYFNKRVRTIKARMYKVDLSKKTKPKK